MKAFRTVATALAATTVITFGAYSGGAMPAFAAPRATIVLDPDDNVGFASWPGEGTITELPLNFRLATEPRSAEPVSGGC